MADAGQKHFDTTHWSVVLAARDLSSPEGQKAMEALCRVYWYPLYAFLRRSGQTEADAKDLTQGFFMKLLRKEALTAVDREKGRFRTFLLTMLTRFVADERDRQGAQKRGGGEVHISLDEFCPEDRYRQEPPDLATPEQLFEKQWALTVLEQAQARLRDEYAGMGKLELFDRMLDQLKVLAPGEGPVCTYAELAVQLGHGKTESAIKQEASRLRSRYAKLIRSEVAQTLSDPADLEDELRFLMAAVGG